MVSNKVYGEFCSFVVRVSEIVNVGLESGQDSLRVVDKYVSGGDANFGQETYWSLERPPQVTLDGFDLYSSQASIAWPRVDLTRPLQRK